MFQGFVGVFLVLDLFAAGILGLHLTNITYSQKEFSKLLRIPSDQMYSKREENCASILKSCDLIFFH